MHRRLLCVPPWLVLGTAVACSSSTSVGGSGGAAASSSTGSSQVSSGSGTGGGVSLTTSGTGGTTICVVKDPTVDMDGDGWTPANGDCNDCDPNVNPGAVDVAGDPNQVDSDCSGSYDPPTPCDQGLALDDVEALDGAKAIELCQSTTVKTGPKDKTWTWGLTSVGYVRADGTPFDPDLQVGLQSAWGNNVKPQAGSRLLAISSGHARTTQQPGACGSNSCAENASANAPAGYPQNNQRCPPSPVINDDVGLELTLRAPTNATGYRFSFKFYSNEYPYWVCQSYNDQFVALVSPAPKGSINGNISFDLMGNPVSVNLGFFSVCDATKSAFYAQHCKLTMANPSDCPSPPSPYCPSGASDLAGTGFDVWNSAYGNAGATSWLVSEAPVTGGSDVTIRFMIWDTGDQEFDSTTLIDDFRWIATKGAVMVGTTPLQ